MVNVTLRRLFTLVMRCARIFSLGAGVEAGARHISTTNPIAARTPIIAILFLLFIADLRFYRTVVACFSLCQSELLALTASPVPRESGSCSLKNSAWPSAKLSP